MTPAFKKKALKQWVGAFPEFVPINTNQAGRIVGPFCQGITLDRDSGNDGYYPTAHFHNLATSTEAITLGMKTRLPREDYDKLGDKIDVVRHEREFQRIISRFRQHAPLPLEGDIRLTAFLFVYNAYIHEQHHDQPDPAIMADLLTAVNWVGDEVRIRECKQRADQVIDRFYPEGVHSEDDKDYLREYFAIRNATRAELERRVEESIRRLKLSGLKRWELTP